MTLAQVFKRPGMYLGSDFSTIDEFHIFINTLGIFRTAGPLPDDEQVALRWYPRFVCHNLRGEWKGCWQYDLLSEYGDHRTAIKAAMILYLEFAALLRERGIENLDEIVESATSLGHIGTHSTPDRLEVLIDEAIGLDDARRQAGNGEQTTEAD